MDICRVHHQPRVRGNEDGIHYSNDCNHWDGGQNYWDLNTVGGKNGGGKGFKGKRCNRDEVGHIANNCQKEKEREE